MGDFEKSFDNAWDKFYNKALRFLSYRPRSEKEIKDYLIKVSKKRVTGIRHSGDQSVECRTETPESPSLKVMRDSGRGQNDEIEFIIEKVISKLKEQKFVNDGEFARWWVESRLRFRPRSINLIKRELLQKGIERDIIDAQISNLPAKQDLASRDRFLISSDLELAKKLIEKRVEKFKSLPKSEIYRKVGSYLARRGFDWETIKQVIDPD